MKGIILILVAILGFIVESAKIRATRTRWVQYMPTKQHTAVPVPAQYYNSYQYYNPQIPIQKNSRLLYSYVDPRGALFNMYGYGADRLASLEAYKAYLKSQNANVGQIYQSGHQTGPEFTVNHFSLEQSGLNGHGKTNGDQIDQNSYQTGSGFAVNGISVAQSGLNGNGKTNRDQIDQKGYLTEPGLAVNGISVEQSALHGHKKTNADQIDQSGYQAQPGFGINGISVEQSGLNGYIKLNGDEINQNEDQTLSGFAAMGISVEQSALNGYEKVNGDQINQSEHQTQPGFAVNGIYVDQSGLNGYEGLISQSESSAIGTNQLDIPIVHKSWLNYGHGQDLNLSVDKEEQNSEDNGQNVYSIQQNVSNPEQINFSVDKNVQNGENKDQVNLFVEKSNDKAELNGIESEIVINGESNPLYSGSSHDLTLSSVGNLYSTGQNNLLDVTINENSSPLYSVSDHDVTSNITNVHSADQSKLFGIANGASLINGGNEISNQNEQNTSTVNGVILNKEQNQNELEETPDNDVKEIVFEVSLVPENDLPSQNEEGIPIDIEVDNKITDTQNDENIISENNLISADDEVPYSVDVDRNRLAENDTRIKILKEIITNPEQSVPLEHTTTVNDLILPTPYSDVYSIYQNYLTNVNKNYKTNALPYIYPYFLQRNQINRYRMPWSEVYPIREQPHNNPIIEPAPESMSPKLVKNLVSSICLNPDINVIPGKEEVISAEKRVDTLLRVLKIFGIHYIPRNIYKNIETSQDMGMRFEFERHPIDYDYAEGAIYYENFPFSQKTDLNPYNPFPSQHNVYVQRPYVKPNKLNIVSKNLGSNEPNSNDVGDVESINPVNHIPEHGLQAVNQDTHDSLQTMNYNEANIMMAGYNTPEQQDQFVVETKPEEKFIHLITEALKPELVRFYYSQCHSQKDEKLVEGIKTLINSLQGEHCEVLSQ